MLGGVCPVNLLYVLSKVFKKLKTCDHLHKCGLFSDFQHRFKCSELTSYLLTVVFDRIARVFNRSRGVAVAPDPYKASNRVGHAAHLHKLKSYAIFHQVFGLILSFLSNRRLHVVLNETSLQVFPVNSGVSLKALFLVLHVSYHNKMAFVLTVIMLSLMMILPCRHDQASDLWK